MHRTAFGPVGLIAVITSKIEINIIANSQTGFIKNNKRD